MSEERQKSGGKSLNVIFRFLTGKYRKLFLVNSAAGDDLRRVRRPRPRRSVPTSAFGVRAAIQKPLRSPFELDTNFELKKLQLFGKCERKIDELNRLMCEHENNRCRRKRDEEKIKRKVSSKLVEIDEKMRKLLSEIAAKQSELRELTRITKCR